MGQIPIGVDDFEALRDNGFHCIGKSMLIGRILDADPRGVYLFTRPRRFERSLNPSMLDAFFDLEYKGNTWFDRLEISEHPECDRYRNRFPVVRVDLKDIEAISFDEFFSSFRSMLSQLFDGMNSISESDAVSDRDKLRFETIADGVGDLVQTKAALKSPTRMLKRHYGEKVVVLIDEYDAPVTRASYDEVRRQILDFMRGVLSPLLKGNGSLQMAVLTGMAQISKESISSGLNNLVADSILSTDISARSTTVTSASSPSPTGSCPLYSQQGS